jgi:hypothetical protein
VDEKRRAKEEYEDSRKSSQQVLVKLVKYLQAGEKPSTPHAWCCPHQGSVVDAARPRTSKLAWDAIKFWAIKNPEASQEATIRHDVDGAFDPLKLLLAFPPNQQTNQQRDNFPRSRREAIHTTIVGFGRQQVCCISVSVYCTAPRKYLSTKADLEVPLSYRTSPTFLIHEYSVHILRPFSF